MIKLYYVFVLTVLFYCLVCGEDVLEDRIVNGELSEEGAAPFLVALFVSGKYACGGAVLQGSTRTILTAAHCVLGFRADQMTVGVGTTDLMSAMRYQVEQVIMHPDYSFYQLNDMAILHVTEDLPPPPTVIPLPLDPSYVGPGHQVTIYGWGWNTYPIGMHADNLYQIDVVTLSAPVCRMFWQQTNANHLCTLKLLGGGACKGDSGGPLIRNGSVVGVLSWGYKKCGTYPDVFTRVRPYISWINDNLYI